MFCAVRRLNTHGYGVGVVMLLKNKRLCEKTQSLFCFLYKVKRFLYRCAEKVAPKAEGGG